MSKRSNSPISRAEAEKREARAFAQIAHNARNASDASRLASESFRKLERDEAVATREVASAAAASSGKSSSASHMHVPHETYGEDATFKAMMSIAHKKIKKRGHPLLVFTELYTNAVEAIAREGFPRGQKILEAASHAIAHGRKVGGVDLETHEARIGHNLSQFRPYLSRVAREHSKMFLPYEKSGTGWKSGKRTFTTEAVEDKFLIEVKKADIERNWEITGDVRAKLIAALDSGNKEANQKITYIRNQVLSHLTQSGELSSGFASLVFSLLISLHAKTQKSVDLGLGVGKNGKSYPVTRFTTGTFGVTAGQAIQDARKPFLEALVDGATEASGTVSESLQELMVLSKLYQKDKKAKE